MNDSISGYITVRLPQFYSSNSMDDALSPLMIGDVYYSGFGRMPWVDAGLMFDEGRLTDSLKDLFARIEAVSLDTQGPATWHDLNDVVRLLDYLNSGICRSEIIAVRSENFDRVRGTVSVDASTIEWLGHDVVGVGLWSLIYDGIFTKPECFPSWAPLLNSHGLFNDRAVADDFIDVYMKLAAEEIVEELPDPDWAIDIIEVGRVRLMGADARS